MLNRCTSLFLMPRQPQSKFRSRRLRLIAGAVCLGIAHGSAFAQTDVSKPRSNDGALSVPSQAQQATALQPDWSVNCTTAQAQLNCLASQSFYVKETGQRFMTVSVAPPRGTNKANLQLQLPLGIYLPAGVSMQFGKASAKTIPIISCDQNGCFAEYAITDAEIKSLLNGENLLVAVRARDQKPLSITVPFTGFDAAYSKLR
jgi:invasion protein IalB